MDSGLKAKWVEALRSGEYKQARASLKNGDSFCCLGVLCNLMALPFDEQDCLDIPGWDGNYSTALPLVEDQARELYERNDGLAGHDLHSFSEIADYIEAKL